MPRTRCSRASSSTSALRRWLGCVLRLRLGSLRRGLLGGALLGRGGLGVRDALHVSERRVEALELALLRGRHLEGLGSGLSLELLPVTGRLQDGGNRLRRLGADTEPG